jgi:plastocyanin
VNRSASSLASLVLLAMTVIAAGCGGGETRQQTTAAPGDGDPAAPTAPGEPAAAAGSARITGTARFEGEVPNLRPVSMSADPACEAKHDGPVASDALVLGDGQSLGNVFVKVTGGLPERRWPVPADPVIIDQEGCLYVPKVVGAMAGQQVKFLNSDGILHNVHGRPTVNRPFNIGMPPQVTEASQTFSQPEDMFQVKCDVHPWMNAYIAVLPHPYFDTTEADGSFEIAGLPAGTYELEAWHERLGTQTANVTVGDGEVGTVELVFRR